MRQLIKQFSIVFFMLCLVLPYSGRTQAEEFVITGVDWPPYEFENPENGLRGFDLEVIETAFSRIGVVTTFKFQPWKRAMETTMRGNFIAVMSCGYSKERAKGVIFSERLSQSTSGFFIRRDFDRADLKSIEEAKGLRVGAVLGWVHAGELKDAGVVAKTFRTDEIGLSSLVKGGIDYLYVSKEATGFQAKKLGLSDELEFLEIHHQDLFLCFSKKWKDVEDMLARFNEGLAQIKEDGTYRKIHNKYR